MVNNYLVVLLLASLMLAGCAYNNPKHDPSWQDTPPPVAVNLSGGCADIGGVYENAGIALREGGSYYPQFAVTVLRKSFVNKDGKGIFPRKVQLLVDPVKMELHLAITDKGVTLERNIPYECRDGWAYVRYYEGEQRTTSPWITSLWTSSDVLLARNMDGNLVAHVITKSEDKKFFAFKQKSHIQNWYLFKKLTEE